MEGTPRSRSSSRNAGKSNTKGSANRPAKDPTKPKPSPTASGQRFQCPRCPKNFSRIENLTRHQANHEEQGKFACPICRKRFTRSDLLNRHRRIHGNQQEPKSQSHVTGDYGPPAQGFDNLARRSTSQDGSSNLSTISPSNVYQTQMQPQGLTYAYQNSFQQNPIPGHHSTMLSTVPQIQGLTSLMEAALAPQEVSSFTPAENINPSLWDGFMRFGENNSSYMGSYDASMSSWIFEEGSPNYLLDNELMNTFDDFGDNPYQFQFLQYEPPPPPLNENDSEAEDEEDTTDWPDKVSRPESLHRRAPRVVPVQHQLISWEPVLQEARASKQIYDCQYPTLFNNQPYVSKAETTNCAFPCAVAYWDAPTAESWKMALGPADTPPVTFYLHALNSCLLRKWIKPPPPIVPTNEFGKIVLMYALQTHIFEWRQSTSMLNPTGLQGTFGNVNSAYDIGEGLRERRRWLKDGLDSFAECYGGPGTSLGASLLLQLGYIALDVSLSDMHLVAGRSVNKNDASFAEENLKYWANSEIADATMSHIYTMLELCHHCINTGTVADSSYEVAVCLFTGGMVCWAFAKLRVGLEVIGRKEQYLEQVRKASMALRQMGCWRMCSMFGTILAGFEAKTSQQQQLQP
ncbi:hypothetical protein NA56DRAFT_586531 [Hyaloscypha hepaticicola]|uniref:C2H2-type domain-containing protein n=1 Tax=Hyaloscypha hepaticicola TaxID=2082293 RepID=A0A2J6PFZ8_9HELO|nr:hypothetical protein NA56DRAFT_586531 [Hyaloscypha hepaticicola]